MMRDSAEKAPAPATAPSSTVRGVPDILDCISKAFALLTQLQSAKAAAEQNRNSTLLVDQGIALQQIGIQQLQDEYKQVMGLNNNTPSSNNQQSGEEESDDFVISF